jgi:hypothetical protein
VTSEDIGVVDFEYTRSRGAHGIHWVGAFDAFLGSQREIWVGSDGCGLVRESRGPVSFFTDAGRTAWQAAGSPALEHGPSIELFAPGCLGGSRRRRARLEHEPDRLRTTLESSTGALLGVSELLGEAVVDAEFCEEVYSVAAALPDVEIIPELADQLGRVGRGLACLEHGQRIELIFASDCSELLGDRRFLAENQPWASQGTLHSWSAFLERSTVGSPPSDIPPVPALPCDPPGGGRIFPIRRGFMVMTGYVNDAAAQLVKLRDQGVITNDEYESAKSYLAET